MVDNKWQRITDKNPCYERREHKKSIKVERIHELFIFSDINSLHHSNIVTVYIKKKIEMKFNL